MNYPETIIVLDCETTGVDHEKDSIIEVAAVKIKNGKVIETFDSLINYQEELAPIVKFLTGIVEEDVKNAPHLEDIKNDLQSFLGNYPIVGHNIEFDINFLKSHGFKVSEKSIDTYILAGMLLKKQKSYSLEALAQTFNISHTETHRAMGDVEATADLFHVLWDKTQTIEKGVLEIITKRLHSSDFDMVSFFEHALDNAIEKSDNLVVESSSSKMNDDVFHSPDGLFFDMTQSEKEVYEENVKSILNAFQNKSSLLYEIDCQSNMQAAVYYPLIESGKNITYVSNNYKNIEDFEYFGNHFSSVLVSSFQGVESYISREKFDQFSQKEYLTFFEATVFVKIILWIDQTTTGCIHELGFIRGEWPVYHQYLSADALSFSTDGEFVKKAFEAFSAANVRLLPTSVLIHDWNFIHSKIQGSALYIDQSEELEDSLRRYADTVVSERMFESIAQKIKNALSENSSNDESLHGSIEDFEQKIAMFFAACLLTVRENAEGDMVYTKLIIDDVLRQQIEYINLQESAEALLEKFAKIAKDIEEVVENGQNFWSRQLQQSLSEAQQFMADVSAFFQEQENLFNYIEVGPDDVITLHNLPRDIGLYFSQNIQVHFEKTIYSMTHIACPENMHVLSDLQKGYIQTVFYEENFESLFLHIDEEKWNRLKIFLPNNIPEPDKDNFQKRTFECVRNLIDILKGGVVGAFNSNRAIQEMHHQVAHEYFDEDIEILGQGVTGGKGKMMEAYKRDAQKSVLFGTPFFFKKMYFPDYFMQGMIIQKLPFDFPNDPILKISTEKYSNVFHQYSIPRTFFRFKKMVENFILAQGEKKYLLILDSRILRKEYGKIFKEIFPKNCLIECSIDTMKHTISQ